MNGCSTLNYWVNLLKERIKLPYDVLMMAARRWELRETDEEYVVESPNFIFTCKKLVFTEPQEEMNPYKKFIQMRLGR